jgi:hypothetical protein
MSGVGFTLAGTTDGVGTHLARAAAVRIRTDSSRDRAPTNM